ncbi:MAG: hypothetical protein WA323_04540 [Candidatus Nitrosopolaris sp.]
MGNHALLADHRNLYFVEKVSQVVTLEPIQQDQLIIAMVTGILGFMISVILGIKEIYLAFLLSPS